MSDSTFGLKIGLEGEREFKRAITDINREMRVLGSASIPGRNKHRRVAAYARVSTDMEEQASSYEAQINYYTSHIKSREDWIFAGMYSDEGISRTSIKRREGFQHMITDALAGKIDLILTKSVSRFARNTVDSLTAVRQLKDAGVEVYFENIYTFDSKGELLITIMSSLAQEESRSISENVTWGHRRRFAEGKALFPYSNFLGYTKNADGQIIIVEDEAKIVRRIYADFLAGKAPALIVKELTDEGVPTPKGKRNWSVSTVKSMLTNEKYKGDALIQKSFTVDFLTKKTKKNEGEISQYYVTNNHDGIIHPRCVGSHASRNRPQKRPLHFPHSPIYQNDHLLPMRRPLRTQNLACRSTQREKDLAVRQQIRRKERKPAAKPRTWLTRTSSTHSSTPWPPGLQVMLAHAAHYAYSKKPCSIQGR